MNRRSLGVLAVILIILMGIVATAGLDNLPSRLRGSVAAAGTQLASDRTRLMENRSAIEQALGSEPALFAGKAADWQQRLNGTQLRLKQAETQWVSLQTLAQANRREDRQKVEEGLARLDSLRANSVRETDQMRKEAERWLSFKRDLPHQLEVMRSNYEAVRAFDIDAASGPVRKAVVDWPAKHNDLEARLTQLTDLKSDTERVWESTAEARQKAERKEQAGLDYASLFAAAEKLDRNARQLREGAEAANQLAQQLYVSWDKLLVDVDNDRYRIRTVSTRFPDATLKSGATSHEERWEKADAGRLRDPEQNIGMVIERKPAGKYDSEAERGAQPAGYAYVAPPGQSNAYGSWSNGVWHWLPQYLLMSQLLRSSSYPSVTTGDYFDYNDARRRGSGYYGRSWGGFSRRAPSANSSARRTIDDLRSGGWWRERSSAAPSGGGFSGSRYQNRGTYSGSRYQSGAGYRSYSRGSFGRSMGRGGRR